MYKHNYIREIGLPPSERRMPWPYALAILAILVGALGWIATKMDESRDKIVEHGLRSVSEVPRHAVVAPAAGWEPSASSGAPKAV